MCGIVAIIKSLKTPMDANVVLAMRDAVTHRGPNDADAAFYSPHGPRDTPGPDEWWLGLGHRRLSILDLSAAGRQPMVYKDRYHLIFNGEIYNYIELRQALTNTGHQFRTGTDTEVVLAAFDEWGEDCFAKLRGMWAIVIYDAQQRTIHLSRDRLGIKPMFLYQQSGLLAVVSEIKQFKHLPGWQARVDGHAAREYLLRGYETPDRSFFEGVTSLPPGTFMRVEPDATHTAKPQAYWFPENIQPTVHDQQEAADLFADKFTEAVRIHLRSDVPVACALSGGMDSSAICGIVETMKAKSDPPLNTFTVTFPGFEMDEKHFVDEVLKTVSAQPHFVTPDPHILRNELDAVLQTIDEPFGSTSIYASYCIARRIKEAGIRVTLNGQGGDELLEGYWQTYFLYLFRQMKTGNLPALLAHFGGSLLPGGNPDVVKQIPFILKRYRSRRNPLKLTFNDYSGVQESNVLNTVLSLSDQERRIHALRKIYLHQLLKWDDHNTMAFSVEGRYPFLDHELIELCLSFSPKVLYRRGWTKLPIRLGLTHALPRPILDRRSKFGFVTPQNDWLCGVLRPDVENWLKTDRPIWDHLNRKDIQTIAESTWRLGGRDQEMGQMLFRVYLFDRWLSLYDVQGDLAG